MSKDMDKLINILHSIYCPKSHDIDMVNKDANKGKCSYHLEESIVDTWDKPIHKEWSLKAEQLMRSLGIEIPKETLDFIYRTINLVGPLQVHLQTSNQDIMVKRVRFAAGLLNPDGGFKLN